MKKYKVICPLFNFQIPQVLLEPHEMSQEETKQYFEKLGKKIVERVSLVDGVKLRRISQEDFDDLRSLHFPISPEIRLSSSMFVLSTFVTTDENYEFETSQTMKDILLALRLLKPGYVSGSYVFYIDTSKKSLIQWSWNEERRREASALGYALKIEEIPTLKKIVKKIQKPTFLK